jgi:RNA polymerase sigma factor (sigma-70 family)
VTPISVDDARALVRACADGDGDARRAFQDRFADDIYNFPTKIYGVPADQAADYYLYAFEGDRIFTRLASFEGRNAIQLRTFLAYYVLKGLFLDWQRGRRELDTVSLESTGPAGGDAPLSERLAGEEPEDDRALPDDGAATLWASLAPEERLDLKLLSLLECDLAPEDLRLLARLSRRPLRDTTALVAEVQDGLRRQDARLAGLQTALDSTWGWVVLRRRELQETDAKIRLLGTEHETHARSRLEDRRRQLDLAVAMRTRQRDRLLEEIRTFKVTTPYKDIARLLNAPVGTVCSRIFRLRQRLEQERTSKEARP